MLTLAFSSDQYGKSRVAYFQVSWFGALAGLRWLAVGVVSEYNEEIRF